MSTDPTAQPPSGNGSHRPAATAERAWLVGLGVLTAVLGAATSVAGLLSGPPDPTDVTSVRGEVIQLYGSGLYQHDSVFVGAGNRGADLVTVALGVPLLLGCLWAARRAGRAALLLPGAFAWFLYVYATMSVNVAYNDMFLAYVVLFGASLFGGALAIRALDLSAFAVALDGLPRRLAGWLMVVSGLVTLVIWLGPVVAAQLAGEVPDRLESYTTFVTYALDSAVIAPAAVLAGALILRRHALGYVIALPLLVIEAGLAPMIAAQTAFQLAADADVTPGEVVGPIGGFVLLAVLAIVALSRVVRGVVMGPSRGISLLPPADTSRST